MNMFEDEREKLRAQNTSLLAQLQHLKQSNENLEFKCKEFEGKVLILESDLYDAKMKNIDLGRAVESDIFAFDEGKIVNLHDEMDDPQRKDIEVGGVIKEVSVEKDCVKGESFAVEGNVDSSEKAVSLVEIGVFNEYKDDFSKGFEILSLIKECLIRVNEGLGEEEFSKEVDHECEGKKEEESPSFEKECQWEGMKGLLDELECVSRMTKRVEEKLRDYHEKDGLLKEIKDYKRRNNELMDSFSKGVDVISLVNVSLKRILECLEVETMEHEVESEGMIKEELSGFKEVKSFYMKLYLVSNMLKRVEHKLSQYQENAKKEKREMESNVVSLTEENRDINALLQIALVEKEALEKRINKLKGNNEEKRVPLLEFAGRSLQRVGFGFIMGGATSEQHETLTKDGDQFSDNAGAFNSRGGSDMSSESEEEVVDLASAVGNMMMNLRLEVTQLRIALDESRSDSERFKSLTEKQAHEILQQTAYIEELENQRRTLAQNVEELLIEIKSTEDDAERWREACKLEVIAGKRVVEERDKLLAILTQELEKTRTALQISNSKIKSKEEIATAAMAAQSAAEQSLQLADTRAALLRERIDVLTRQLEESDSKEKHKSKFRRICWPWQAFMVNKLLPETQPMPRSVEHFS